MDGEQLVAIVSTEGAIKREVKRVRQTLADANIGSDFCLTIQASGRIQDGEVKLSFGLANNTYGADKVTGHTLQPVLDEFLRRHGWEQVNAPKAIAFTGVAD